MVISFEVLITRRWSFLFGYRRGIDNIGNRRYALHRILHSRTVHGRMIHRRKGRLPKKI